MKTGFIGLGHMGWPMARNLARAGTDLIVWNRSRDSIDALLADAPGVAVADSVAEVFAQAPVVILMLANSAAIDAVLERGSARFASLVRGRTLIHMGTTSPEFSLGLQRDLVAAGARYVEAPVSGSRVPAELGQLVGMLAGDPADVEAASALLAPMCSQVFRCGAVPQALRTKLAVNLYLVTLVASLAEAAHLAERSGVDLQVFRAILDAGPMASRVSSGKLEKMITQDFSVQAALADVLMNVRLIHDAARAAASASPLLDQCLALYSRADQMGLGGQDMAAVIRALDPAPPGQDQV
ncbi:NAD(P)-dependent oxidoreductase [Massilia sp. TS11]|uniref:NAD(P)-dependent oxidoreductase n=1 Tax=Massilia sp. TS11 TaxID=2908003 RepID=UPI001EDB53AE|nr:NAD(P)-dependent oxidoreductase [Massilia sp. TS11]MCG2584347.1 NAD(P)-dependent oxidoreductase [Massilia sp. TS11]